ncbi:MAG: aldo/keto reductase, partial [Candidatus Nanohaloarchaea archaeon]
METVPELGLGTWRNTDPEKCRNSVEKALNIGYRHIDTAQHYHNEKYVGEGIKASKVDREDFFLASKVWTDRLSPGKVVESIEHSLERLGVDRIDLMYVHYPAGDYRPEETLKAFEKAVEKDLIGSIGLSNFLPGQVDEAIRIAGEHIVAHQFEMHPLLPQDKLVENSVKHGIQPVAYSPLARGEVFNIKE